jgi:hypothetical protein
LFKIVCASEPLFKTSEHHAENGGTKKKPVLLYDLSLHEYLFYFILFYFILFPFYSVSLMICTVSHKINITVTFIVLIALHTLFIATIATIATIVPSSSSSSSSPPN